MAISSSASRAVAVICVLTVLGLGQRAPAATPPVNDEYYSAQWGLEAVDAPEAWAYSKGRGAVIAIVDTGADLDHPDLRSKLVPGRDFTGRTTPQDLVGHGTHVAGIAAAATNNGIGIAGMAPAAKIMPLRVCGAGCDPDAAAEAILYAVGRGADVINLSFGVNPALAPLLAEPALTNAIEDAWTAGAVVVAGAGNNTMPLCSHPASAPHALCVGAVDELEVRTYYSDGDATGAQNFLVAPGGRYGEKVCEGLILSTVLDPDDDEVDPCKIAPGYEFSSGTSMAAPFVSGAAALLAAKGFDNEEIVARLLASATDLGPPGRDPIYGYGLLNAEAAFEIDI